MEIHFSYAIFFNKSFCFFVHRRGFGCKSWMSCGEAWDWRKSTSTIRRASTSWRRTRFWWRTSGRGENWAEELNRIASLMTQFLRQPQEVQSTEGDGERRHSAEGEARRARRHSRVYQIATAAPQSKSNLSSLITEQSGLVFVFTKKPFSCFLRALDLLTGDR